nr:hypothetical protein [Pseudomonas syringae pv. coryli]
MIVFPCRTGSNVLYEALKILKADPHSAPVLHVGNIQIRNPAFSGFPAMPGAGHRLLILTAMRQRPAPVLARHILERNLSVLSTSHLNVFERRFYNRVVT